MDSTEPRAKIVPRIVHAASERYLSEAASVVFEYLAATMLEVGRPVPRAPDELPHSLCAEWRALDVYYRPPGALLLALSDASGVDRVLGCLGVAPITDRRSEGVRARRARARGATTHRVKALAVLLVWCATAHADPCSAKTCFDLALHVVPDVVTDDWLEALRATANRHFAAVDAGFDYASRDELPASATHIVTREDRDAFAKQVTDTKIHVFVIGKLENVDDDAPVHGVTWRAKGKKYIIVAADSIDRVLAHELGHVFGLPHSTYKISIMNKTKRDDPPMDQRRFSDEELALLKPAVARLAKTLAQHAP